MRAFVFVCVQCEVPREGMVGAEVTGIWEMPNMDPRIQCLVLVVKQQVLVTTEPSLQPQKHILAEERPPSG